MQKLMVAEEEEEDRGTAVNPVKFNAALPLLSSREEKDDSAEEEETLEMTLS